MTTGMLDKWQEPCICQHIYPFFYSPLPHIVHLLRTHLSVILTKMKFMNTVISRVHVSSGIPVSPFFFVRVGGISPLRKYEST